MRKIFGKLKLICMLLTVSVMLCMFTACDTMSEYEVMYDESIYNTDAAFEDTSDTEYETESNEIEALITERTYENYSETESATESEIESASVEKDGRYTTPEDVAEYIHTFGTLPSNFITKKEAQALGWDSKKGNLWDVADGMSIGGDYFGNYEGLLPEADGRKYTECDVNYEGGYRGSERIIFSNDGLIFYTNDHYETFTQLY